MNPTRSVQSIYDRLNESLGETTRRVVKRVPVLEMGLIVAGRPPRQRYTTEVVEERHTQWSKLVGVLLCPPSSKAGKEEILPSLDYFHHRSGLFVDFFCVGYRPRMGDESDSPPTPVTRVGGKDWYFDARDFDQTRRQLEFESRWRFSGETDLLLAVARKEQAGRAYIDYSCAIACNLEEMGRDGAIASVRGLFEKIFRFGEDYQGDDPVWALSDQLGLEQGGTLLQEAILKLVPEAVQKRYKAAKHFAIANVSR